VRLTAVALVAASFVGTITAASAALPVAAPGSASAPAVQPVLFDDQVAPAGCACAPRSDCAARCDECDRCDDCDRCGDGDHGVHTPFDGGCASCDHGYTPYDGRCCERDLCDECCGLLNDCGCCEAWIRFRAEVLPMHRSEGDDEIDFAGLFTLDDFDFTYEWGFRAAAEIRMGCDHSAEVVYIGQHRWEDDVEAVDLTGTVTGIGEYESRLNGGEINFWRPLGWRCCGVSGAFMFGTRYLNLKEEFTFLDTAPLTTDVLFETDNHIVAAQLGWVLNGELGHGCSVRWDGKAAAGANLVFRDVVQTLPQPGITDDQEDSDVAFIGDTSVVVSYQICSCVSVYAGYYLMWVDGLALAPEQFEVPFDPTDEIDHNGFVFFQGGIAGIEVMF
jgi:hypothetical protein